ncbi:MULTISPECIES: glycosyltransferase family 25 protein [unclassified Acinetobacter]|uniref:glycosyltransferase family 25 protein n=1 Tax=unclassified Acinetobacter TaxID=196816 RepID=UPI0015D2D49D|nr:MULTISPECIES: glycosyltransferase family 25 protein [unclassified Acinetobacter]
MRIYMISLKRDAARREAMQKRFPKYYSQFHIIDAVDAKDASNAELIAKYDKPCPSDKRRPLTQGEKCCAISHLLVLENFLQSGNEHCIIIEDDIIGEDADFDEVIALLRNNELNGLVVLGGQEGLKNTKYLIGSQVSSALWQVSKVARRFLFRTCCYSLDTETAKLIISSQSTCLTRADAWNKILPNRVDFFYSEKFRHPVDLKLSSLEADRRVDGILRRVYKDGLPQLLINNFTKLLVYFAVILKIRSRFFFNE